MKKNIDLKKVIITIVMCVALLKTNALFATNSMVIELKRPSNKQASQSFSVNIKNKMLHFTASLSCDDNNQFIVKTPPFVCLNFSTFVLAGELNTKGLLSLMIDPFSSSFSYKGFNKGSNVALPDNPALKPKLSGITISGENIDIIALNSILNPSSPNGFGVILGDEKSYAAFLTASQNNILIHNNTPNLQLNWKHLGYGKHMFFSLAGSTFSMTIGSLIIKGMFFLQNAWDIYLGGGSSTGIGLKIKAPNATIEVDHRLGGVGVKLKDLYESENPTNRLTLDCNFGANKANYKIDCRYSQTTFALPSYGGESQEMKIEFRTGFSLKDFHVTCTNTTHYETDKGKSSFSFFEASYKLNSVKIEFSSTLNRPIDEDCFLSGTTVSISNKNATLSIKGEKTLLQYNFEFQFLQKATAKVTIDQDRAISTTIRAEWI